MKVLLVDPVFYAKGGGTMVTFWAMQALLQEHELSLLSWGDIDFNEANRLAGTSLDPNQFEWRNPPLAYRKLGEFLKWIDPSPWCVQRWALMIRWVRKIAPAYDVVLSTNGEIGLECASIQYVHYPYLGEAFHKVGHAAMHWRPWRLISGFEMQQVSRNLSLSNSNWTGAEHRAFYQNAIVKTLYPPVPGEFPKRPWAERENGFVCIGRFNYDKNLTLVIDTVAEIRKTNPEFHLHLVGLPMPEEFGGIACYEELTDLAKEHSEWLFLEVGLSREAMVDLISRHRYGIHAKQDEHFGIAVAEMVKAGCITFVHNSGGQIEIVDDDSLVFEDQAQAICRALAVIDSPSEQQRLRDHIDRQGQLFSSRRFMDELLQHVRECASS